MNDIELMNIADYFVLSSIRQNIPINNLKLQKLLYFFYARRLFENRGNPFRERFQKWQYGPVMPSVYHAYKLNGGADIKEVPRHYRFEESKFVPYEFDENDIDRDERAEIDGLIASLADYTAFDLVKETHKHDEWANSEAYINAGIQNIQYDDDGTREYFQEHPDRRIWQTR